jgi:L-fuculose-phosphate aldolase
MPFIKDSNTIILQNHGTVCFDVDLENCYYKLEIVDAYSRILLLAKQVGSIRPLDGNEMKELLELKAKFGMADARTKDNFAGLACASDFVQRVGRPEMGSRGIMAVGQGTSKAPATASDNPPSSHGTRLEQAVAALAPQNYSAADVEQLVQVITDQIMASA